MAETPFDSREIVVLLSALFVFASSLRFRSEVRRVPRWRLLSAAMIFLVMGGASTIAEHIGAYDFFNVVEHLAYLCQSLLLAAWALALRRGTA